ncbi:MAG: hypothetical protein ACRCSB_01010 [Bacteroidales bacterium]
MQSLTRFMKHLHKVRQFTSPSDMVYVACACLNVFYEYSVQSLDVAAAIIYDEFLGDVKHYLNT